MSKNTLKKFPCKNTLAVLVGVLVGAFPVFAQEAGTNAPTVMKETVVTGSFIPTAETVGPAPVETVTAAQLETTGQQDVLSALKIYSPAFQGSANVGQTLNNGGYGEAYISLRNLPTLVLLDGARLNISPFSTFVGTYAVDVNTIPVGMIDHVEILKDGASAIYGSDAVGGVVNIITKKDYNGAEVDFHYGFATGEGSYNEYRFSAVAGYAKDGTKLVLGGQYYYSDPLFTKDRAIGSMSATELQAVGLNAPSYFSPSYPGRVGSFILAGSSLAQGAPGYIAGLNAPPPVTGGPFYTVEAYNLAAQQQLGYTPYIPITSTPNSQALGGSPSILNTTLLDTMSIQKQDRRNVFGNLEQDIFEERLVTYGQFMYSHNQSEAQLAPAPIPFLSLYNLGLPANNPGNVFGIPFGTLATNSTASVRSRLIETGPRMFESDSDFWHFVGGLKGDLENHKYHYDLNAAYSQTTSHQVQNSASSVLLNQAMTPGAGGLSQLGVPLYNILALPGVNDPATIDAIKASAGQGGFSDLLVGQGIFNMNVFDLPAGTFQLAAGGQYIRETMNTTADPLLASGNLIGLNASPTFSGGMRSQEAGFVEAKIPVTEPKMDIPVLHSLEIDASGRYEAIQSGANDNTSLVPKVGIIWKPFDDQVALRFTYSQGFVVPPLFQMYGPPVQSNPYIVSPEEIPPGPTNAVAVQQTVNYQPNADIPPSTAETITAGIVISPKPIEGLTVSVDYYHIQQPEVSYYPSGSAMVADLNANGANSIWYNNPNLHGVPVYLDQGGNPYVPTGAPTTWITSQNFGQLNIPLVPGGSQRTEGIDFMLNYKLDAKDAGVFNMFANANLTLGWDVQLPGSPWVSYKGQYTDLQAVAAAQGLIPGYSISTGFTWSFHHFDYTVIARYIPGVTDFGDLQATVGAPSNDFTANGQPWSVPNYYKVDMQLAYNFVSESGKKWYDNTRIALGCNNISNTQPNLIASSSEDNTDKSTYDIIGRFIYVELTKKF
jgi:iron complex outermembrane recepter protein